MSNKHFILTFYPRTNTEREILERLPPGTLDYLAITDCDDGAMKNFSIKNDPDDPTMVQISYMQKRTALDQIGWSGFSSDQLYTTQD